MTLALAGWGGSDAAAVPAPPAAVGKAVPATPARPELRWVLTAHPDSQVVRIDAATRDAAKRYLAAHPDLPTEVRHAIEAHEVWLGMREAEIRLALAAPSSVETGTNGQRSLVYGSEGWVLRFSADGFLESLVER